MTSIGFLRCLVAVILCLLPPRVTSIPLVQTKPSALHHIVALRDAEEDGRAISENDSGNVTNACGGCSMQRNGLERRLSPEELRRARIEVIKQQILQKLRLKDAPQVRLSKDALPGLLTAGNLLVPPEEQHVPSSDRHVEDFYGTTQNVIIFPENKHHGCLSKSTIPTSCFYFKLTPELLNTGINSAEVYIQKLADTAEANNHTIIVTEFTVDSVTNELQKRIISVIQSVQNDRWLHFEVSGAVARWTELQPDSLYGLEISCTTCEGPNEISPVSDEDGKKPFLVIRTDPSKAKIRTKRSVNCVDSTTHCCREEFHVSFKEIGWDNWILQPSGYKANYCRGSCLHDVSISRYHHTTVVQRYLQSQSSKGQTVSLSLCCTPSRMSAISLIYIDDDGYIFQKNLPNMVVESCDCA